ncbi:MAG: hypothetical protein HYT62_04905 [Candidatus Yanofskybacteria bacterium]|nr:hypothetical protein [Candidatus Yanofskybacteria bacterium]
MSKVHFTGDEKIALQNPHFVSEIKQYRKQLKRLSNSEVLSECISSAKRNGMTREVMGFRSLQRRYAEQEVLSRMTKKRN